jgi:hypothetical protein
MSLSKNASDLGLAGNPTQSIAQPTQRAQCPILRDGMNRSLILGKTDTHRMVFLTQEL